MLPRKALLNQSYLQCNLQETVAEINRSDKYLDWKWIKLV
jgi:hypothetical protein